VCALEGVNLQIKDVPKPQGDVSLHLTFKCVERSGGHLFGNSVNIQTKLLFTCQFFAQEAHKCLESLTSSKNQKFHRWENSITTYQQQSLEKNLEKSAITFCLFPDAFAVFSPISRSTCSLYASHFAYNVLVKLKPTFLSQRSNKQLGRS